MNTRPRGWSPALGPLACAGLLAGALLGQPALAQGLLDEATAQVLVQAVEAAVELDLYNARCRSDQSGRRTENLNKVLAGRFRITVIGVEDKFFPERSYRKAQERIQNAFLERLKAAGGCADAKTGGLREVLEDRQRETQAAIDGLP